MTENINLIQALGISILGFAIVFVVLAVLILVVKIISAAFGEKTQAAPLPTPGKTAPAPVKASSAVAAAASAPAVPLAPGSAGGCELHGVDPKIAAMLMAIVADKTGLPLNELRFRSIREIKD